jgi:uncharacterized repeat protein (TIGR03803 family)
VRDCFELTPNSDGTWTKTTIYAFRGGPGDGAFPVDRLIFDRAGNIDSTTDGGGDSNFGTIFKLTPSSGGQWTESLLHFFTGGLDGSGPIGTLAIGWATLRPPIFSLLSRKRSLSLIRREV